MSFWVGSLAICSHFTGCGPREVEVREDSQRSGSAARADFRGVELVVEGATLTAPRAQWVFGKASVRADSVHVRLLQGFSVRAERARSHLSSGGLRLEGSVRLEGPGFSGTASVVELEAQRLRMYGPARFRIWDARRAVRAPDATQRPRR